MYASIYGNELSVELLMESGAETAVQLDSGNSVSDGIICGVSSKFTCRAIEPEFALAILPLLSITGLLTLSLSKFNWAPWYKEARFKNSGFVQRNQSFDMIGMARHIVGIDS